MNAHRKFANLFPHRAHGLLDVLRWQFGFGPVEIPRVTNSQLPPYEPQICAPQISTVPPEETVRVTWVGQSTFLIQHGGRNILTDPIFGNCQPMPIPKLRRVTPPGISFAALPQIHDVIISHCHYDHLDAPTIRQLGDRPNYWLPRGLARWFHRRGINNCH